MFITHEGIKVQIVQEPPSNRARNEHMRVHAHTQILLGEKQESKPAMISGIH